MTKAVKSVTKKVFGGGGSPGVLGTGRAGVQEIDIATEPFQRKVKEDVEQAQARASQQRLAEALERRAAGEQSVARQRIAQQQDRAMAERRAEAAGRRGLGGALAARESARIGAQQQQELAREGAAAEAQERTTAQQALAQALATQRAQDIGVSESDRASEQALEQLRVSQRVGSFAPQVSAVEGAAQRRQGALKSLGSAIGVGFEDGGVADVENMKLGERAKEKEEKEKNDNNKMLAKFAIKAFTGMENGGVADLNGENRETRVIPGQSYQGDKLDAKINSGEVVLNVETQQKFLEALRDGKKLPAENIVEKANSKEGKKADKKNQKLGFGSVLEAKKKLKKS